MYFKWKMPLQKHGMVPEHSFFQSVTSCLITLMPEKFYDKVEEGSIVLKRPQTFSFCKNGLSIDGEGELVESDLAIFATGFKGDQKLRDIFTSKWFQQIVAGSSNTTIPLYRSVSPFFAFHYYITIAKQKRCIFCKHMNSISVFGDLDDRQFLESYFVTENASIREFPN